MDTPLRPSAKARKPLDLGLGGPRQPSAKGRVISGNLIQTSHAPLESTRRTSVNASSRLPRQTERQTPRGPLGWAATSITSLRGLQGATLLWGPRGHQSTLLGLAPVKNRVSDWRQAQAGRSILCPFNRTGTFVLLYPYPGDLYEYNSLIRKVDYLN